MRKSISSWSSNCPMTRSRGSWPGTGPGARLPPGAESTPRSGCNARPSESSDRKELKPHEHSHTYREVQPQAGDQGETDDQPADHELQGGLDDTRDRGEAPQSLRRQPDRRIRSKDGPGEAS